VDRWWHGHGDAGARWCTRESEASGHSRARELADRGGKERGKHVDSFAGLVRARAVVWRLGDDDEAVVKGSSVMAALDLGGRGKRGGGGAMRSSRSCLLLYGSKDGVGRRQPSGNNQR
jgi:hypothetical protein